MPIRVLPPEVASRIAAGEVVERPASVVKELLENSLDAGADEIRVEVREGGRRLIRVVDNGCGIPAAEVALAFHRHATSKLLTADDLEHITTLGFRGEALASIASVSQLTMLTRAADEAVGTQVRVEGGLIVAQEPRGAPPGTTVTVEHLFYNVPARLKFLRQPATEAGHVSAVVQQLAMAFPERRFSLVSDGRLAFQSTGTGRLLDVLVKVFGLETARQMAPIGDRPGDEAAPADPNAIRVWGFAGLPPLSRSNRSQILLFLNRRPIQDRTLTYAVTEAYRHRLMVGRFPVAVVAIAMDPAQVDVNVHPAKAEVRFRDERAVFRAVQRALQAVLAEHAPVPEVRSTALTWSVPGWAQRREALISAGQAQQEALWWTGSSPTADRAASSLPDAPPGADRSPIPARPEPPTTAPPEPSLPDQPAPPPREARRALPMLRVVGQMGATYIVAEGPEGMYLVDQHAAHERILYEQLMAQAAADHVPQQALLEPVPFEAGSLHAGLLAEYAGDLAAVGFDLEPFGRDTWLVRAVPAVFAHTDPGRALEEVLEGIADGRDLVGDTRKDALIALICKRAAIKGGQALSMEEMRHLVRQLEACQNPTACPHGRPTMLVLSTEQLAREFGRRG
ncbi:MAG: DNA mismatch repair endonuclease MutL [Caldilineales bacterium]|nr:DNA mismatch repair endonuclease MutL [Caldilineales bacterium]MDW8316236.1 DNA mismatch repair endonuclease MutL [Anaerolineae bacterium]